MSFAALSMGFAWLLIAGAAAAAVALFLIRPRPPRLVVSSLAVWRRVLDESRDVSFWDRIRWWVSLAVTAVIAVAIALALARPVTQTAEGGSGRVLLVLDSSWSMLARTPSGETRWDRAIAQARAIAASSGGAEIAIATTAEGVIEAPTSDASLVRRALDRIVATGAAEGAWPRVAGGTAVHLFTDGTRPRVVPPEVVQHSAFAPASNVAVTAFDVRASMTGVGRAEAFVSVANHAQKAQTVRLVVTRGANALLDRTVSLGPGQVHPETISLPIAGDPRFRAHVSAPDNALEIDDAASVWLAAARPLVVGVVGTDSTISRLLAADPSLRVLSVQPASFAQAKVDVWVFDRWLPEAAPAAPALLLDPPASTWFGARAASEADPVWSPGAPHEILEGVDTEHLDLGRAHAVARPALQPVALSARRTPLVAVEDGPAGRYVVFGFSTAESNLEMTPAFPVLIGNAVDWLGRPARGTRRLPGPMVLPAATTRVLGPDGRALRIDKLADRVLTTLTTPGLYLAEVQGAEHVVTVTLGDARGSNLLVSTIAEDRTPGSMPTSGSSWWVLAAMAALLLVSVEWFTWQRRVTV